MTYTIAYKDFIGRFNKTQTTAKDEIQAKEKFNTLYPTAKLIEITPNE